MTFTVAIYEQANIQIYCHCLTTYTVVFSWCKGKVRRKALQSFNPEYSTAATLHHVLEHFFFLFCSLYILDNSSVCVCVVYRHENLAASVPRHLNLSAASSWFASSNCFCDQNVLTIGHVRCEDVMSCIRSPYKKYMDTLCIHINKQQQLYLSFWFFFPRHCFI